MLSRAYLIRQTFRSIYFSPLPCLALSETLMLCHFIQNPDVDCWLTKKPWSRQHVVMSLAWAWQTSAPGHSEHITTNICPQCVILIIEPIPFWSGSILDFKGIFWKLKLLFKTGGAAADVDNSESLIRGQMLLCHPTENWKQESSTVRIFAPLCLLSPP